MLRGEDSFLNVPFEWISSVKDDIRGNRFTQFSETGYTAAFTETRLDFIARSEVVLRHINSNTCTNGFVC